VTVKVFPAIVSVPVRADVAVFAVTENDVEPEPVRLAPAVIVSQLALLVAAHAHPEPAVTETVPVDAPAPNEALVVTNEYAQPPEEAVVVVNVFEGALIDDPPGPTADTRAR
jgi:hypothetical protein